MAQLSTSAAFGTIGGFGMAIFFGTAVVCGWDDAPLAVMIPSGVAMWGGYPLSWYLSRRKRQGSRPL